MNVGKTVKKVFFVMSIISFFIFTKSNVKAYTSATNQPFDTTGYHDVSSTQEAVDILLRTRAEHKESVVIRANPSQVKIECDIPNRVDLDPSIYNHFHYGYTGGPYNAMDYDVAAGPSCSGLHSDPEAPSFNYYLIEFCYHDNDEELKKADNKLLSIMASSKDQSPAGKVVHLYNWMLENLPAEKESASGYPRNCNGIYGCLFGDGTGFCCSTYASTIQRYCELAGINAWIVGGAYEEGEICHAFNTLELDGKWYAIDYPGGFLMGSKSIDGEGYTNLINKYMPSYKFSKADYLEKNKVLIGNYYYYVFSDDTAAFAGTAGDEKTISIPAKINLGKKTKKVTKIAASALSGNKNIKKVTIPASIKIIDKKAFFKCRNLKTVSLSDSVISINKNAFGGIKKNACFKVKASKGGSFNSVSEMIKKATNVKVKIGRK